MIEGNVIFVIGSREGENESSRIAETRAYADGCWYWYRKDATGLSILFYRGLCGITSLTLPA